VLDELDELDVEIEGRRRWLYIYAQAFKPSRAKAVILDIQPSPTSLILNPRLNLPKTYTEVIVIEHVRHDQIPVCLVPRPSTRLGSVARAQE